ncbi:6-pyruvoyl trahydropterin synthase family protein [Candidatus Kinetoplastidibacterium galati]|uniref:6-carboxy-5,6,7,8-tetrahydropterin synthase n=1 Tax=Candidatus Kinetoplastidibacterium galati TCC219 TaxID=1208921 RepID=M1LY17_9PROT|nr:6-carboxytetrahydropterin synthase [Candidatus Kinetoplastibacterium galatii]AGF48966.1 6-pyruvoyl tetrahydrobiopterin synthase [Candidatus Kinetoplastibacterium galatii TCC219]
MISISRKLEFDAGHRIPNHNGKCSNIHGHRYSLIVTLEGEVSKESSSSDHGMLMDFADVKLLALEHIINIWDHAFLVSYDDYEILNLLKSLPNHKTVILDKVPTVENLAIISFKKLKPVYSKHYRNNLSLKKVCLYETPNCWSEYIE